MRKVTKIKCNVDLDIEINGDKSGMSIRDIVNSLLKHNKRGTKVSIAASSGTSSILKAPSAINHNRRLYNKIKKLNLNTSPKVPTSLTKDVYYTIFVNAWQMHYWEIALRIMGKQDPCYNYYRPSPILDANGNEIRSAYEKVIECRTNKTTLETTATVVLDPRVYTKFGVTRPSVTQFILPPYNTPKFDEELRLLCNDLYKTFCDKPVGVYKY